MRIITIGLATLNTTVGALRANSEKVIHYAEQMARQSCAVGCFSEQVISGYPVEDLVQWQGFVEGQWSELMRIAEATKSYPTVLALGLTVEHGGHVYNAAAVVWRGKICGLVPKEKLPLYNVFYERRTFSRGIAGQVAEINGVPFGDIIFRFPFGLLAVEVCEDSWSADGPMRRRAYSGAELILNVSASPWRAGVLESRREILQTRAYDNQAAVVYVNQVGAQDSLVFDGGGYIVQNGRMLAELPRWREGLTTYTLDLDSTTKLRHENTTWRTDSEIYLRSHAVVHTIVCDGDFHLDSTLTIAQPQSFFIPGVLPARNAREDYFEDLLQAMTWGLKDYFEKSGVFERIGIAISGGKDSVLSLIVAWLYAQKRFADLTEPKRTAAVRDFICCFSMPTHFNSATTKTIARQICDELGVSFSEISIEDAFAREVSAAESMLGGTQELTRNTRQNIQARIRAGRMWNWANTSRGLFLQTGNMTEKAVGYTTVGGDLMGAYSLIGNLPKTVVIELLRYLDGKYAWPSLKDLFATKASAELEDDQEDERDLMPFAVLDDCFALFAGEKLMPVDLYRTLRAKWSDAELKKLHPDYQPGQLKAWVIRFLKLFIGSIYKWVQAPQTVHLGTLDLDRERALQLPAIQSAEWLRLDELENEN